MQLPNFSFPYLMILLLFAGQLSFILYLKHQAVQWRQSATEKDRRRIGWNQLFLAIAFFLLAVSFLDMKGFFSVVSFPPRFPLAINHLPTFFSGLLIPALFAPFVIFMHILSLKQLFYMKRQMKKPFLYTGG